MLIKNKTIWTPDNSFLLEYKERAGAGDEIIGEELWLELENLAEDFMNDRYFYDTEDAMIRMNFMENCVRLTKSPYYNKPMVLMLWQKAFIEAVYSFKMSETAWRRFKKILLLIARKNTKALALDTRIPTPDGDKTIKDIKAGDFVFNENGKSVKVLETSEIFRNRPCYEITFEDGEKIVCDENHKWTVQTKGARRRKRYIAKTSRRNSILPPLDDHSCVTLYTHEMINDFKRVRSDGKGTEYKYRVPVPGPVEYPDKKLFSPYVLGLWLGDGDKNDNRIACGADDLETLVKEIKAEGINVESIKEFSGKYEVRFGKKYAYHKHDVREAFREMGVWKNKHIPEEYFTASIEQRMELLRGLMDTDGMCSKAGQCSFTQKDKKMISDFSRLLSSLGIKHSIKEKYSICNGKKFPCFQVFFWTTKSFSCFRYKRKHERLKDKLSPRMEYKSIVNIKRVESRDTKCITVDSERGLFLCGNKNTVTHNSETCSALGLSEFCLGNAGSDIVASSNDDAQASIIYDAIDTMRLLVDPESFDTKRNQRFILNKQNNSKIFKLSDRTRNKEGRNIDTAFLDESHEMTQNIIAKSIEQSQSLKDEPLFFNLTTEGFVVDGYLDEELKKARAVIMREDPDDPAAERLLPWLYTQDSEAEVWEGNRENRLWMKSNPTLGIVKKWEYMEEQVALAKKSKADRIFVLSKDFNIKQNSAEAWLNLEDYDYGLKFDLEDFRGAYALGAVDLAETTDLCALKVLMMKPDDPVKYIYQHYFIPETKLVENNDKQAGAKYEEWRDKGYLTVCEGNDIDLSIVADHFYMLYTKYNIRLWKCGYDQKFAKDWIKRMEYYGWMKTGGEESELIMVLQNAATLSNAIKLAEADFKHQLINYNDNDMDKWNYRNAGIKVTGDNGQCLIVKMESQKKIDGAVCLAILYEVYRRVRTDYKTLIGG